MTKGHELPRHAGYCGLRLSLDIELPELTTPPDDHHVELKVTGQQELPSSPPHRHRDSCSDVEIHLTRVDGKHVFALGKDNMFKFEQATRVVSCPSPLDPTTRHQLLDHVLPRVLDGLGHLMVHGSAVNTSSGALVFVGDTGLGKSTLAASFENAGFELLSDDCMRLTIDQDGCVACTPTYRSLRLWPDSAYALMTGAPFEPMDQNSSKRRFALPGVSRIRPAGVAAICALAAAGDHPDVIHFAPVPPARAVSLLLAQCFRLDLTDAEATKRAFEACADVVARVPVLEMTYPRHYERLSEVRDAVLRRTVPADRSTFTTRSL